MVYYLRARKKSPKKLLEYLRLSHQLPSSLQHLFLQIHLKPFPFRMNFGTATFRTHARRLLLPFTWSSDSLRHEKRGAVASITIAVSASVWPRTFCR